MRMPRPRGAATSDAGDRSDATLQLYRRGLTASIDFSDFVKRTCHRRNRAVDALPVCLGGSPSSPTCSRRSPAVRAGRIGSRALAGLPGPGHPRRHFADVDVLELREPCGQIRYRFLADGGVGRDIKRPRHEGPVKTPTRRRCMSPSARQKPELRQAVQRGQILARTVREIVQPGDSSVPAGPQDDVETSRQRRSRLDHAVLSSDASCLRKA